MDDIVERGTMSSTDQDPVQPPLVLSSIQRKDCHRFEARTERF
jgi:hypothetical protein